MKIQLMQDFTIYILMKLSKIEGHYSISNTILRV